MDTGYQVKGNNHPAYGCDKMMFRLQHSGGAKICFALMLWAVSACFYPWSSIAQDDSALFEELKKKVPETDAVIQEKTGTDVESMDTDMDLFEELDTAAKPEASKSIAWKLIRQVWDNNDTSLRLRYGYFFDELEDREGLDNTMHMAESLLRFSTWIGTGAWKLNLSGWAEWGTQDDTYRGLASWPQDPDNYRRFVEFNEIYGIYALDAMDITLGKKNFNTGISTLYSPSDRFRPSDLHDPLDPKQFGLWQLKAEYFMDRSKFELALLPVYTFKKYPAASSRWWGERDDDDTDKDSNDTQTGNEDAEDDPPNVSWEYMDLFARYKTTWKGWDFFVSGNSGPNPYSVIRKEDDAYIRTVNRIFSLAGGFSTTKGKFEIHGESLFNLSYKGRDDDYISSVIGFTYTIDDYARYLFMEKILLTLEYAGEIITDRQDADDYTKSSRDGRAGINELLSRIEFKYDEDLRFKNSSHFRISDLSWMNRFEISYKIMGGLTMTCAFEAFEDEDDDRGAVDISNFDNISYAQWDKNDRIVVSLTYEF